MEPKVYVVQIPMMHDPNKKGWVNRYDLSAAHEHGQMVRLLPSGNIFRHQTEATLKLLAENLSAFTESDFILALGDPIAISAAVMIASKITGGKVKILKFDKPTQKYVPFDLDISK